jgi:hypothetical protein
MKMRTLVVLCLAAAVLLPAVVYADLTVTEETRMNGMMGMLSSKGVETTYIKGDKMRAQTAVEMGGAMAPSASDVVTITRLDKGLVWFVDNADSTYSEMSLKGARAESSSADFKVKDVSVKRTGQTKTILGEKCDGVEVDITIEAASQTQSVKSLFWMRPEVKDMAEMRHFWDAMVDVAQVSQGGPVGEVMGPIFAKIKEIPGVPLGVEMTMTTPMGEGEEAGQQAGMQEAMKMLQQMQKEKGAPAAGEEPSAAVNEVRVTRYVTQISKGPLADALFEVPKGYKKVEGLEGMFNPGPGMMEGE